MIFTYSRPKCHLFFILSEESGTSTRSLKTKLSLSAFDDMFMDAYMCIPRKYQRICPRTHGHHHIEMIDILVVDNNRPLHVATKQQCMMYSYTYSVTDT
jgi:hypothetical protein